MTTLALSMLSLGLACAPTIAAAQDAAEALDAPSDAAAAAPSDAEATTAPSAPAATTAAPAAPQQIIVVPAAPSEAPPPPAAYVPAAPVQQQPVADAAPERGGYMPTWGLLVPGLAMFVSTYLPAVLAGLQVDLTYGTSGEITGWLYVPCVGPFVLAGYADGLPDAQALFVILGLVQTAGLSLTIAGLAVNSRGEPEPDAVSVSVMPVASREMAGLVMGGQF